MLAYTYRFHGYGSLRYLIKHGATVRSRHMVLKYVANRHRSHPRIAVVVSKKVFKSAVKRNRIRRRVFEAIRLQMDQITGNYDMSFTVNVGELIAMPHQELLEEVQGLIEKMNHDNPLAQGQEKTARKTE